MMKKRLMLILGISAVIGVGTVMGTFGGAKQVIRMGGGTREVTDMENGGAAQTEEPIEDMTDGAEETAADMAALVPVKIWGTLLDGTEDRISLNRQFPDGSLEETIIHIDPEQTLILDSESGYPLALDQIQKGDSLYLYVSPAMTMSLPPQTTAVLVLAGTPQDKSAPEYVVAAGALEDDGQGGWLLADAGGMQIRVPADCPVTPYLTRQIVMLSDIEAGRRCLVWTDGNGQAERIVLFNE